MTTDLSPSFGVDFTIIKNLTNERQFLAWFPTAHGHGRFIEPLERIRFGGNLFEAILGFPDLKAKLERDIQTDGIVAVTVCGTVPEEYESLDDQVVQISCQEWEYESSSSLWMKV